MIMGRRRPCYGLEINCRASREEIDDGPILSAGAFIGPGLVDVAVRQVLLLDFIDILSVEFL